MRSRLALCMVALLVGCGASREDEDRVASLERRLVELERRNAELQRRLEESTGSEPTKPGDGPESAGETKPATVVSDRSERAGNGSTGKPVAKQPSAPTSEPGNPSSPAPKLVDHPDVVVEWGALAQSLDIGEGSRRGNQFVYEMTARRTISVDLQDSLGRYKLFAYDGTGKLLGESPFELLPRSIVRAYRKGERVRVRFDVVGLDRGTARRLAFQAFRD